MLITDEQRAVLAHVVPDPDAWVSHALDTVGEDAVLAKITRWQSDYLAAVAKPGYMTRAQRDADTGQLA